MDEPRAEIWIEKYRPHSLKDMVGQARILPLLQSYVSKKTLPHLLFAGPPGTGKTTAALAIARDLYGDDWRDSFLELNASVTADTPVLVRLHGKAQRTTMGDLASVLFTRTGEKAVRPEGLEVLSSDVSGRVGYHPVSSFTRHRVSQVARITVEGGSVRTSLNHSVIIVDKWGRLTSVPTSAVKVGDVLLSFATPLEGRPTHLNMRPHAPSTHVTLGPGRSPSKNPTVRTILDEVTLDMELAWTFGNYTAEGCASPTRSSGNVVFTHGYPQEIPETQRVQETFNRYGFHTKTHLTKSGFKPAPDGSPRYTSIQTALSSTQWMRFFRANFYRDGERKDAHTKAVPPFIFDSTVENRLAFLDGYSGDAQGSWGKVLRYVSVSDPLLIDVAWLARTAGLESSFNDGWKETMVCWPQGSTYRKADLLPAAPFCQFLEGIENAPEAWRYQLCHSLYGNHAPRTLKGTVLDVLDSVDTHQLKPREIEAVERWRRLAQSDLYALKVISIDIESSDDYVYDFSVPGTEMFFGGTVPLLLHNSDERGIETVRTTIKSYARSAPLGGVAFKILFLDEADMLTPEAQGSLRRMMERYSTICRFIISCNYSSRIIEPIQSRCTVFRFKSFTEPEIHAYLERIAKGEKKHIAPEAFAAILRLSGGDLRSAVNILQTASTLNEKVDADSVYESASAPLPREVEAMIASALQGDFRGARERLYQLISERGASGEDMVKAIHTNIPNLTIPDTEKVRLIDLLAEVDFRLVEGASERLQLEAFLARLGADRTLARGSASR